MRNISSAVINDLLRREVASPRYSATFYLCSKQPAKHPVLKYMARDFVDLLELVVPESAGEMLEPVYQVPVRAQAVRIIPILMEKHYVEPFIMAMAVTTRQQAATECGWLFREMTRQIQDHRLDQTIAWWSRPLHDAGRGYLTVAFRPCDMREMV